jgi:hypothetical protein
MHRLWILGDNSCGNRRRNVFCQMILTSLTQPLRSLSRREPLWRCSSRRTIYWGVLCSSVMNLSPAMGVNTVDTNNFKLYAHSRIIDAQSIHCLEKLWTKESNWNPRQARNGSHYGIPQMRNSRSRSLDAYTQIDWGLRYIKRSLSNTLQGLGILQS